MSRPLKAVISQAALIHNYQQVRLLAPQARILAIIKANAYGHGAIEVAKTLTDVEGFAVASFEEALDLRAANISQPIILLSGLFRPDDVLLALKHDLDLTIHHPQQAAWLLEQNFQAPVKVWLHIDTAMRNVGLTGEQLLHTLTSLDNHPGIQIQALMTHFSCADEEAEETTSQQISDFFHMTRNYRYPKSLANSAGLLTCPQSHADWVRPGLMLYGATSLPTKTGAEFQLQPVMTLESSLVAIRQAHAGDRVGYGGTWICPQTMLIGTVAVGYGDGYPRHASSGTPVLVKGHRAQLIGRVAMDLITVDFTSCAQSSNGRSGCVMGRRLSGGADSTGSTNHSTSLFC